MKTSGCNHPFGNRRSHATVESICPPHIAALFVDRAERVGNNFRLGITLAEGRDARDLVPIRAGLPPTPDER